jgi:hypothetical protein
MRNVHIRPWIGFLPIVLCAFLACGPSKPAASDYIGAWKGATAQGCECLLDISPNATSFVLKNLSNCRSCETYEGLYTLSADGNLIGGPMNSISISYNKQRQQAAFSPGGGLQYLVRLTVEERDHQVTLARLADAGFVFSEFRGAMCSVSGTDGPCLVEPFVSSETTSDRAGLTCAKLDRALYEGDCAKGALNGLAVVVADGSAKANREGYLAYFSHGRILFPALTASIYESQPNFGVQELRMSYGCVYYGDWDESATKPGCVRFREVFGNDIFSEANARALVGGKLDLAKYRRVFLEFVATPTTPN